MYFSFLVWNERAEIQLHFKWLAFGHFGVVVVVGNPTSKIPYAPNYLKFLFIRLINCNKDWRKETNKGNDDNSLPWKTEEDHHQPPPPPPPGFTGLKSCGNGSYLVPRQSITNKFNVIQVIRHIRHLCLSVQRMAVHKALVTWKIEPFSLYSAEWYSGLACCDIGLPSFFMRLEPSSNTSRRSFTHLDKQVSLK